MISEDFIKKVSKRRLVVAWKDMNESQKMHFVNQIALAMTVWGSDKKGKELVIKVLDLLLKDGSSNLTDFGLYVDNLLNSPVSSPRRRKIKKAALVLEGYRLKNSLSSEPHKPLNI